MSKNKKTTSNIDIKSYYGDLDNKPGKFPFKGGIYPEMYRDKL